MADAWTQIGRVHFLEVTSTYHKGRIRWSIEQLGASGLHEIGLTVARRKSVAVAYEPSVRAAKRTVAQSCRALGHFLPIIGDKQRS